MRKILTYLAAALCVAVGVTTAADAQMSQPDTEAVYRVAPDVCEASVQQGSIAYIKSMAIKLDFTYDQTTLLMHFCTIYMRGIEKGLTR